MELFDKRFVHFMWDDKLEGQKVFVADNINTLIERIKKGTSIYKVHWSRDTGMPFESDDLVRYRFAYYDPNYEVKRAFYKESKQIQVAYKGANNWVDCDEPEWVDGCQFRVKPECPCEDGIDSKACVGCEHSEDGKKEYRPYINAAEMIMDFIDRFKVKCPPYCEPLIWVRLKVDKRRRLIVAYGDNFAEIGNKTKAVTLQHLFEQYEFLDGSPCGMEVKE